MSDVKYLEEKVLKAEEKVTKCEGTIERHKKALAKKIEKVVKLGVDPNNLEAFKWRVGTPGSGGSQFYWEICELESKQNDIKGAQKKLKEAEEILANWRAKLDVEREKERFLDGNAPEVIKTFLEDWKKKAYEWHIKRYADTIIFKKKLREEEKKVKATLGIKESMFPTREQEKELKLLNLDWKSINRRIIEFAGNNVLKMFDYTDETERLAWLEKTLEEEKKRKMLDLINRINSVVGAVADAKGLRIDVKGNLNGVVIGEDGKAKVETVGAGGYNVQCFHFRTLVNKIK